MRDLCYYLIQKPCYRDENRAMPPRLGYFVYFPDFEMYTAHRAVVPAIARHLVLSADMTTSDGAHLAGIVVVEIQRTSVTGSPKRLPHARYSTATPRRYARCACFRSRPESRRRREIRICEIRQTSRSCLQHNSRLTVDSLPATESIADLGRLLPSSSR